MCGYVIKLLLCVCQWNQEMNKLPDSCYEEAYLVEKKAFGNE